MSHGKAVSRIALVLRWIAGLAYAFIGINGLLHLSPMPEGTTPAAMAFFAALRASGFMLPLLATSFLIGGLLLLLDRTAPLGLIILSPPIVVIPLYNTLLEKQPFTSGPFVLAIHFFLAWFYWERFKPLWTQSSQSNGQSKMRPNQP